MDISEFCNICLGKYPLTNVFKKKDKTYATVMSLIGHGIIKEESLYVCVNCIVKMEVANNIKEVCVKNLVYFRYSFLEEKLKLEKTKDRKIRDKLENLRSVQISNLSNILSSNLWHIKDDNEKYHENNSNKSSINNDRESIHNKSTSETDQFSANDADDESNNESEREIQYETREQITKRLLSEIAALDEETDSEEDSMEERLRVFRKDPQFREELKMYKKLMKNQKPLYRIEDFQAVFMGRPRFVKKKLYDFPDSLTSSDEDSADKSKELENSNEGQPGNQAGSPTGKQEEQSKSNAIKGGYTNEDSDKPIDAKIPRKDQSNIGQTGSYAGSCTEKQSNSNAINSTAKSPKQNDDNGASKPITTSIPMKDTVEKPVNIKTPTEENPNKAQLESQSSSSTKKQSKPNTTKPPPKSGKDYSANNPIYITIPIKEVQHGSQTGSSTKNQSNCNPTNSSTKSTKTNGTDEKEDNHGRFHCFDCPKRFHLKEDLINHHEVKHRLEAFRCTFRPDLLNNCNFKCAECGKIFPNVKSLASHKLMHRLSYPLR